MSVSAPLIVMSFNRPEYLRQTLESLVANGIEEREVHLFQDGAVSANTGVRFSDDKTLARSQAIFRELVPHGTVHASDRNLGIAFNFRRAERFIFQERDHELAYFFEDDLVLSPHYLEMMERVGSWAVPNPKIAYFATYGHQSSSPDEQQTNRRKCIPLGHHWAFAVKRTAWEKMNDFLDQYYYPMLQGMDYKKRGSIKEKVFNNLKPLGLLPTIISQDAMKGLAMSVLGLTKINTFASFGAYIGEQGEHFSPESFREKGFGNTVLHSEPLDDLEFPSDAELDQWIAAAHATRAEHWSAHFNRAPGMPSPDEIRKQRRREARKRGGA